MSGPSYAPTGFSSVGNGVVVGQDPARSVTRGTLESAARYDAKRRDRGRRARAVSIIDVLVVISIVLFLLALLVPSLHRAREQVRRVMCANNLRQWGNALQMYRGENNDYIPAEGTYLGPSREYTWYDVLPPYLGAPSYRDVERSGKLIKDFPELHVWICPSKNMSRYYKSGSGKNQFHYGMNMVLDGMNSALTPDFPDLGKEPITAHRFAKKPFTVFMFDIFANKPAGKQKDVATRFHRDYANVLYVDNGVADFASDDFVRDHRWQNDAMIWDHPRLYWGYMPKATISQR